MRYFKFDGIWPNSQEFKRQHTALIKSQEKQHRKQTLLHRFGCAISILVALGVFVCLLALVLPLLPEEKGVFGAIMHILSSIVFVFLCALTAIIAGLVILMPIFKFDRTAEKQRRQELMHHACQHLREYYGLQEPFLVTKCYRSSNKAFDRHDVCLFIVGGELRITANLHYGFFDPVRDLGCYTLIRQEIRLQDSQFKERKALELQAGDLTFLLGCRAKAFIENNFLGRTP